MSVTLSIDSKQVGVRLMELPSELCELLESAEAPVLQLKSSETPSGSQVQANAVLCTPNQTYEVRQVQSSNVLYVLQQTTGSGFTAIAQCKGMLELVKSKGDAIGYVLQMLPIYTHQSQIPNEITRSKLSKDSPFSENELDIALKQCCALTRDGSLWIPDPLILKQAWKTMLTTTIISGTPFDREWNIEKLISQTEEDGLDLEIIKLIVQRLNTISNNESTALFDAVATTTWVGQTLLYSADNPRNKTMFIEEWQDSLPEAWRSLASLDLLKDKFVISDDGLIMAEIQSTNAASEKKPDAQPKSKWHQKFRK